MKHLTYSIPGTEATVAAVAIAGDIHVDAIDGALSVTATVYDKQAYEAALADPAAPKPIALSNPAVHLSGDAYAAFVAANPAVATALEGAAWAVLQSDPATVFGQASDYTPPTATTPAN